MKTLFALTIFALLSACGGGGSSNTTSPVTTPPAVSATATPITGNAYDVSGLNGNFSFQNATRANVTISGLNNNVWFAKNQLLGAVDVSGTGNVIVFGTGDNVTNLTISGLNNDLWIPQGSGIAASINTGLNNTFHTY